VRIRVASGKTSLIDGPFAETKELVGGFAICELESKEKAIESARQFMSTTCLGVRPAICAIVILRL
jgi:hypothetical protein